MNNYEINFNAEDMFATENETKLITVECQFDYLDEVEEFALGLVEHGSAEVDYLVAEAFGEEVCYSLTLDEIHLV